MTKNAGMSCQSSINVLGEKFARLGFLDLAEGRFGKICASIERIGITLHLLFLMSNLTGWSRNAYTIDALKHDPLIRSSMPQAIADERYVFL